ncbi:MAG: hypothetical protein KDD99_01215 [Bacteroidetes bacterium]|nr:hypothetical protein [Bacteroidota bacterium]
MDAREEIYVLIDRYLNNQLNKAEREAFEEKCKSDPELAQALILQTQAEYAVRSASREQRKQQFNQEFDRLHSQGKIFPLRQNTWILLSAAAVLILLLVAFWGNLFSPSYSPEELFAQNFEPLQIDTDRNVSASSKINSIWREAGNFYTIGEFDQAIMLMEEVVEDSLFKSQAQPHFYLGMSYLQTYQKSENQDQSILQKAVEQFEKISEESVYREKAEWYQALAYLGMGNKEAAKVLLKKMMDYGHHYKDKQIREIWDQL